MKRKKPKVLRIPFAVATVIGKDNVIYALDRVILITAKKEIEQFEMLLKSKGKKFKKDQIGNYFRYWIEL